MLNAIVDASLRYKVLVLVAFAVLVGLGSWPTGRCRWMPSPMSRRPR
jgi:Cu/Ag efflux pump CusA